MSERDSVLEAFTELSTHYEHTISRELQELWGITYAEFIRDVVAIVPNGHFGAVLDVATGTAQIPIALATRQADVSLVGLDLTPAMLKSGRAQLRRRGLENRVQLVCASAMDMPFPDNCFDTVVCGLAMHHLHVPQVIAEIERVLRQGGSLILADVNLPPFWRSSLGNALIGFIVRALPLFRNTPRVRAELAAIPNLLTAGEWRALLARSGLRAQVISSKPGRRPLYPDAVLSPAIKSTGE